MRSLSVLAFVDYYLPAVKAGGPITALANAGEALCPDVTFRIVTADRDLGDTRPFDSVSRDLWTSVDKTSVYYASSLSARRIARLIGEVPHDIVYLNSLFSRTTMRVLALRRLGLLRAPVILAPRGELAPSALRLKSHRKRAWLSFARWLNLFRDVQWQASSDHEAADIRSSGLPAGTGGVVVTPEIATVVRAQDASKAPAKRPGELRIIALGRISPMKNFEFITRVLAEIEVPVRLDIYGPIGDVRYWNARERDFRMLPSNIVWAYHGSLPQSEVQDALAGADILFAPSLGENFGHVIIEALASGCPVITSDKTPWGELREANAGWDLSLDDPAPFRNALHQLSAMGSDDHAFLRQGARDYARKARRNANAVERQLMLFTSVLSTRERQRPAGNDESMLSHA